MTSLEAKEDARIFLESLEQSLSKLEKDKSVADVLGHIIEARRVIERSPSLKNAS